jgi:hypothetical protein
VQYSTGRCGDGNRGVDVPVRGEGASTAGAVVAALNCPEFPESLQEVVLRSGCWSWSTAAISART